MAWNQRSNAPEPGTVICRLQELEDGKGREFTFSEDGFPFSMFVVRKAELIRAYVNECPHTGVPLNWSPDEFTSDCLLYTSPSPRDGLLSRMPSSA